MNVFNNFRSSLARHLVNYKGWQTTRKIIVIESDDWGSIRMPSKEIYDNLLKSGIRVDRCPYNRYDSLASEEDLSALFDVLTSFRDMNGNHPVITANTVVANPDFEKIKASGFKEYYYEPFTETLKRYPRHAKSFDLWQQGMNDKIFFPQFHGREHVNITLWLNLLQQNNSVFRQAFELGLWGLGKEIADTGKLNIQAAFDAFSHVDILEHKNIIKEGLNLFEAIFGYKSKSFIANNFIWDTTLNTVLAQNGIAILQGMKFQLMPILDFNKREMIRHYTGKKNEFDQIYLVRNCVFEPTQFSNSDNVAGCIKDIQNAFLWNRPAIITAHRLNFIGSINITNRNQNLAYLKILLSKILKMWPDIEFASSEKLGEIIRTNN